MDPDRRISLVTLVSDDMQYALSRATLSEQSTGDAIEWIPIHPGEHGWNAAEALNVGLSRASSDWVVCAHQDVLFPFGWLKRACQQIDRWPIDVAVAGLVGVRADGQFRGHVLDTHGHCRWLPLPDRVCTIDEHLIMLRNDPSLRFDPATPGFHCYGPDIALQALARKLEVIVIDAPVVHLSRGVLDAGYREASAWLLGKWSSSMKHAIPTSAGTISRKTLGTLPRRFLLRVNRRRSRRRRQCTCDSFRKPPEDPD